MSLNTALRIATNGLNTAQIGLATVSHNISNSNTAGFSRQSAVFSTVSFGGIGEGVRLESIQRQADSFLEARLVEQTAEQGFASTFLSFSQDIETQLGDPTSGAGLDQLFNGFFNQISNLANFTTSSAQQRNTIQQAELVVDNIRDTFDALSISQTRADAEINQSINVINGLLTNIDSLNQEISNQSVAGSAANANDLIDTRQRQINELAAFLPLQISDTENNGVRISTTNGRQLIDVGTLSQLERVNGTPFDGVGVRRVLVDGSPGNSVFPIDFTSLDGGSIQALTEVRDTLIPNILSELNNLTVTFADEFNRVHSQGSSFPPPNSLTSGNNSNITATTTDLFTEIGSSLQNASFNISVVDSTGDPILTTLNTGLPITGAGPITLPGAGPFSLDDLVTALNTNADVGVGALGAGLGITASTTTDAAGNPALNIAASDPNLRIVITNVDGDFAGDLGLNNFFTGNDISTLAVRADIAENPQLLAVAQSRSSDGGLSNQDNRNALELANLSDRDISFGAAGTLPGVTDSVTGYVNQIFANFAIGVQDATSRNEFADGVFFELQEQVSNVSGVNINEEFAQLIIFQNSFQASARIISTIDQLFDVLFQNL